MLIPSATGIFLFFIDLPDTGVPKRAEIIPITPDPDYAGVGSG